MNIIYQEQRVSFKELIENIRKACVDMYTTFHKDFYSISGFLYIAISYFNNQISTNHRCLKVGNLKGVTKLRSTYAYFKS